MNQEEPSGGSGDEGGDRKKDEENIERDKREEQEKWPWAVDVENPSAAPCHFLSVIVFFCINGMDVNMLQ